MEQFAVPPMKGFAQAQTREHSSSIWEGHRDQITQLYSVQNKSLGEVMSMMEMEHSFVATQRQYKIKISEWHLDKNIKDDEIRFIAQTQAKRALEEKDTNFRVRGRDVDPEKISRAVKRKKITEDELLAMPSAPTPSDISYGTPSAADPQSPYVQQMVAQSPGPTFAASTYQVPVQATWNASEWQNQAFFLVSPGYLPATPLPVVWHGPSIPLPSTSFQTPPGMLQSPDSSWNTAPMGGMIDVRDTAMCTDNSDICETKYDRLIELVRKTEETEISDYMETMTEVNSLVYDLVTSDQQRSQVIVKESSATIPECYVCKALKVIGNDDMAAKVESERVLLEAIAISEGCFGEEHRGAFHFRVKLFLLYENWNCRWDSTGSLLIRIILLDLHKVSTGKATDLISDILGLPDDAEAARCSWLQASSRAQSLDTSSHELSTLSIRDDKARDSPRNVWGMMSAIFDRGVCVQDGSVDHFEPFLELVLQQGPESADGSSYFWMATFSSVLQSMWGAIYNSKTLIGNAAIESFSSSNAVKSSLERLLQNPYRLEKSVATAVNGEPDSELNGGSSLKKHQSKFDDISQIKGPLGSLEELRLVLAEVSLRELERSDKNQAFPSLLTVIGTRDMHGLLCRAAQTGNSSLIKKLAEHFGNATFEHDISFVNLLNLDGQLEEWDLDLEDLPLHLAIKAGYYLTVMALLNAGADPDGWRFLGVSDEIPMNVAANSGYDDILRLLFKWGADASVASIGVLRCIIGSSDEELHAKFLETISDHDNMLFLLYSIALIGESERYELLDAVLERIRGKVSSTGNNTELSGEPLSRLMLGRYDREELHDFLEDEDDTGRGLELVLNALAGVHIEQQARKILKTALFGSSAAMNEMRHPTKPSKSPILHTLVSRNAPNALDVFLKLGPTLAALDSQGNTALHVAAARNRAACAKHLLSFKIDVDAKNNDGETALQVALRKGHRETSDEILMVLPMSLIVGGERGVEGEG